MKHLIGFLCLLLGSVWAQQSDFDTDLYHIFLSENRNLTGKQLLELHPAGLFEGKAPTDWIHALYSQRIDSVYDLTEDEIHLIKEHGFVVSERLQKMSFGQHLLDIYHADLPVYISSDMILHAFHFSYNEILKMVELQYLRPRVAELLELMHNELPVLASAFSAYPEMQTMFQDVDLYLSIPRMLLEPAVRPVYAENEAKAGILLNLIESEQPADVNLFAESDRTIDFSQFKPRGHYEEDPLLQSYFRAMIWLGRIEIYLIPPRALTNIPTEADIERQIIDASLIHELFTIENCNAIYREIEQILTLFVGAQDNVTADQLTELKDLISLKSSSEFLDSLKVIQFQDSLRLQPYAEQRILSQILMNDPVNPDSIVPACAFLLFGQRFVIDSYVTGNVVYDRVKSGKLRMLPSTLDILFTLGNDAAGQLLQPELEIYRYAPHLAALRYLVDAYDTGFWESTLYNNWLQAIRTLNPPADRRDLPGFMQTAAWWQKTMNTQLSSWTELRHDNLLYAKQSYSGGVVCSYPRSYVEPVPEFFDALANLSSISIEQISKLEFEYPGLQDYMLDYFRSFRATIDTLGMIAAKELEETPISDAECDFLRRMLSIETQGCAQVYNGWYPNLYFHGMEGFLKSDQLVADYHTAPTDEFGNMVGWVAHAGTGPIDLAILVTTMPDGRPVAYAGPVMSYLEYTSTNFQRLTDSEWQEVYLSSASRPEWVRLYMADKSGSLYEDAPMLMTGLPEPGKNTGPVPESPIIVRNYPNPFNSSTLIQFNLPVADGRQSVHLKIYDITGREVAALFDGQLPPGNYLTRWDGTDRLGMPAASGVYFYRLQAGDRVYSGKMQLIR